MHRKVLTKMSVVLAILLILCSCTSNAIYESESEANNIAFESIYNASLERVAKVSWMIGSLNEDDISKEEIAYIQGYLAGCIEADDSFTFSHAYADLNSEIVQNKEYHAALNEYDDASWRYLKEMERIFLDINAEKYITDDVIDSNRVIYDSAHDLKKLSIMDESIREDVFAQITKLTDCLKQMTEETQKKGSGTTYTRYTLFAPRGYESVKFAEMDGENKY
ncbi:MAG: hypothetical protein IKV96_04680 [Firmicutes bacterium]|nr:hypothetical protein [Bacillota bacterium]